MKEWTEMKETFYILGTNKLDKVPAPKDFDLFKIEATNLDDAIKLAIKQSDKRYFCSINLTVINEETLNNEFERSIRYYMCW